MDVALRQTRQPSPSRRAAARCSWAAALAAAILAALTAAPPSHADVVAYLVNVTVRPGYNFPNADAAIRYGEQICAKVGAGESYSAIIAQMKSDLGTADDYQAGYLVNQAVNELCPALIWDLRNSAAAPGVNR